MVILEGSRVNVRGAWISRHREDVRSVKWAREKTDQMQTSEEKLTMPKQLPITSVLPRARAVPHRVLLTDETPLTTAVCRVRVWRAHPACTPTSAHCILGFWPVLYQRLHINHTPSLLALHLQSYSGAALTVSPLRTTHGWGKLQQILTAHCPTLQPFHSPGTGRAYSTTRNI